MFGLRRGYARETKDGMPLDKQQSILLAAGVAPDVTYLDGIRPPRSRKPKSETLPQRDFLIRSLRPGDTVVVATASVWGLTLDDCLNALAAISERGAVLYVANTETTYRGSPEAAQALDIARQNETERRKDQLAHARKMARARLNPRKALVGDRLKEAKELWPLAKYSAAEVSEKVGVSARTLYRTLGERGVPTKMAGKRLRLGQET